MPEEKEISVKTILTKTATTIEIFSYYDGGDSNNWILATGDWNDEGIWIDEEVWND